MCARSPCPGCVSLDGLGRSGECRGFVRAGGHPSRFPGKGLGKAVMAEGLRRMKVAGMRRAIVGFDPTCRRVVLYTSMGFRASCDFSMCRKEL